MVGAGDDPAVAGWADHSLLARIVAGPRYGPLAGQVGEADLINLIALPARLA